MLNIYETKEIIIKWIDSCETEDQTDLLADIVRTFIVERFSGKVIQAEIDIIVDDVLRKLADKKVTTRLRYFKPLQKIN